MKFVDVKNDVAFRKIFGNEKKKVILISFLNAVLGLESQNRVKEVTLLNPFQLPRIAGEKSSIIDVKATDEKGSTFIVEMQIAEPAGFNKRVLYYTSKDYAGQINIGEEYPKLRPVNWSREEYDAYIYAGIREQDERGRVEKAIENEKYDMILVMNDEGLPLSMIAKITKLDQAVVAQVI